MIRKVGRMALAVGPDGRQSRVPLSTPKLDGNASSAGHEEATGADDARRLLTPHRKQAVEHEFVEGSDEEGFLPFGENAVRALKNSVKKMVDSVVGNSPQLITAGITAAATGNPGPLIQAAAKAALDVKDVALAEAQLVAAEMKKDADVIKGSAAKVVSSSVTNLATKTDDLLQQVAAGKITPAQALEALKSESMLAVKQGIEDLKSQALAAQQKASADAQKGYAAIGRVSNSQEKALQKVSEEDATITRTSAEPS